MHSQSSDHWWHVPALIAAIVVLALGGSRLGADLLYPPFALVSHLVRAYGALDSQGQFWVTMISLAVFATLSLSAGYVWVHLTDKRH